MRETVVFLKNGENIIEIRDEKLLNWYGPRGDALKKCFSWFPDGMQQQNISTLSTSLVIFQSENYSQVQTV